MKKLLALVLALVMTLGLATVGTNAAATKFGDDASIKYTEAAAVMSAIGVFDGDDSSNFRPTETLKRSEAAKIVAYLMLTKKTADGLVASGSRYNDVPANHWAAGYIEYLTSAGVLGGVGDGKFNPDGDITTVDFAKMLLVALGFDAKIENLVLSDYRINTVKLANEIKLFDGNNDVVATNAITRDEAALYAFNLVKAPLVEYNDKTNVSTRDGVTVTIGNGKAKKLTSDYATSGDQTIYHSKEDNKYIVEFGERYFKDLKLNTADGWAEGNEWKTQEFGSDALGRPMRQWFYKNVDLGKYVVTGDLLATYSAKVTKQTLYDLLTKSTFDNLKDGRKSLYVYLNGESQSPEYGVQGDAVARTAITDFIERNNADASNKTGNGSITEVYRNNDGDVTLVTYYEYVYKISGDYREANGTVRLTNAGDTNLTLDNSNLKVEDHPQIKDYKGDDYVLVTVAKALGATRYEVQTVKKATILTGEVSAYTKSAGKEIMKDVTINGETKEYSVVTNDSETTADVRLEGFAIGKNATVVLDSAGYIVAVDEAVVVTDYVLIRNWGKSNSTLSTKAYADAIFSDGTSAEIRVKEAYDYDGTYANESDRRITKADTIINWHNDADASNKATAAGKNLYRWYAYSKNSAGEYILSRVSSKYKFSYNEFMDVNTTDKKVVVNGDNVQFITAPNNANTAGKYNWTGLLESTTTGDKLVYSSVKANDKTVMVLRDSKDDLYTYTGVKNLSKVTLDKTTGHTAGTDAFPAARVSAVTNADGYAIAVFVEVNVEATISGSANDNLIYVRDYEKDVTNADKTWYNYRIFTIDGEKTNAVADNRITTAGTYFVANYASRNKDGNLTSFTAVNLTGKKTGTSNITAGESDTANKGYITWSNGALTFHNVINKVDGGKNDISFTVDKDAKVLLVKLQSMKSSMGTKDSFELYPMVGTAQGVVDELMSYNNNKDNGVYYRYTFVARTNNESGSVIKELYVTVGEDNAASTSSYSDETVDSWLTNNYASAGAVYDAQNNDIVISKDYTITGSVSIKNAKSVTINGKITNNGTFEIQSSVSELNVVGHLKNAGTLTINATTTNIYDESLQASNITIVDSKTNIYGAVTVDTGKTLTFTKNVVVGDDGNVDASAGTFNVTGNLTIEQGGTAKLGVATIGGNLKVEDGADLEATAGKQVKVEGTATINGDVTNGANVQVAGDVKGTNKDDVSQIIEVTISTTGSKPTASVSKPSGVSVNNVTYSISGDTTTVNVELTSTKIDLPATKTQYEASGWTTAGVSGTEDKTKTVSFTK